MAVEEKPKKQRGGARPGSGRPRGRWRWRSDPPHRKRPELSRNHPVHVVLRTRRHGPPLRQGRTYRATRQVLARYLGQIDFRVVHLSIQKNHFHLIVEAKDRAALTRAMRSLAITLAKALNAELGGSGKVFPFRYHATQIRTPRQARNTLAYVLNNWRRHREDFANGHALTAPLDRYATGLAFDGWREQRRFRVPADHVPLPVSPPETWLLRIGWQQVGTISMFELPGTMR